MWFSFKKRLKKPLDVEVSSLSFTSPVGYRVPDSKQLSNSLSGLGFVVASSPKDNILPWVSSFKEGIEGPCRVIVNISQDIIRAFSLAYDFSDAIIVSPDGNGGIESMDVSDTHNLLDELLSLRLCYAKYTPIFLRLSNTLSKDELISLISFCRLSSVDGFALQDEKMLKFVIENTQGRMPIIACAASAQEGEKLLRKGAALIEIEGKLSAAHKLIKTLSDND